MFKSTVVCLALGGMLLANAVAANNIEGIQKRVIAMEVRQRAQWAGANSLKNARKRRWAPCEPHQIWLSRL
jgi:hypothetical protein